MHKGHTFPSSINQTNWSLRLVKVIKFIATGRLCWHYWLQNGWGPNIAPKCLSLNYVNGTGQPSKLTRATVQVSSHVSQFIANLLNSGCPHYWHVFVKLAELGWLGMNAFIGHTCFCRIVVNVTNEFLIAICLKGNPSICKSVYGYHDDFCIMCQILGRSFRDFMHNKRIDIKFELRCKMCLW